MNVIYAPSHASDREHLSAASLGALCALGIFALLPILATMPNPFEKEEGVLVTTPDVLPPPFIPIIPKPPVEPKVQDKPILEKVIPKVDLTMLEMLINPTDGGVGIAVDMGNSFVNTDTDFHAFLPEEVDTQPRVLVAVQPIYPYSQHGAAEVIVEFIIDANGKVLRPRVVKSTRREFEQAALDSVTRSKWQPGQIKGENVRTLVRLPVRFRK